MNFFFFKSILIFILYSFFQTSSSSSFETKLNNQLNIKMNNTLLLFQVSLIFYLFLNYFILIIDRLKKNSKIFRIYILIHIIYLIEDYKN